MPTEHREPAGITVVIPCRNEAEALPAVLAALPAGYQPIVVDNGSTDDTAAVATGYGARVVVEPRPGYGSAVQAGIAAAGIGLVAVLDGDGSMDPGELPLLVAEIRAGADLAVGRRCPVSGGIWPWHTRLGNRVVARRLRRRYGLPVHDIGAMRVADRQRLESLGRLHDRFGYPLELLVRAAAARWDVREVDISYRARAGGRSKVSGSVRGSLRATRDFLTVLR
ncbi:glycosyltransferase family 2 protein [Nocardia sp. NBC_01329]|uniref:glycosyltransferase family 2 protein n=1 Tax=Nocardia sp. NBC_01329 TaxID=2903594 RepID=UPI002E0EA148|nr:glycosyltransferase family 2 protein [Nocardia sp. NBC_01329]